MISDLQSLPARVEFEADLCIVGSGPAGLTLAAEFAGTKHTVLLLEAGGLRYEPASQELYAGQVTGRNYPVMSSRLRMFGGTSGHWTGQSAIPLSRHIRERPWVSQRAWPIGPEQLAPYYRKASRLLELGDIERDEPAVADGRHVALPAEGPLVPFVWRKRFAGPLRFGERMKRDLEQAANVHVVLHANVARMKTNDTASQVEEIQFTTLDGRQRTARARYFVLACGGLEIPRRGNVSGCVNEEKAV
jgi:choline dehydrogenase-like flavoprotein